MVYVAVGIVGIDSTVFESLQEPNHGSHSSENWKFPELHLGKIFNYEIGSY